MPYPPTFSQLLDITQPLDSSAANLIGQDIRNLTNEIMQRMALLSGTLANRPTMDTVNAVFGGVGFGWLYFATDNGKIYQWNGASWTDVTSNFLSGTGTVAASLGTTGSPVNVNLAAPPTVGQVLEATDATHATWQTPSGSVIGTANLAAQNAGSTGNIIASVPATALYHVSYYVESSASGSGNVSLAITWTRNGIPQNLTVVSHSALTGGNNTAAQGVTSFSGAGGLDVYADTGTAIGYAFSYVATGSFNANLRVSPLG